MPGVDFTQEEFDAELVKMRLRIPVVTIFSEMLDQRGVTDQVERLQVLVIGLAESYDVLIEHLAKKE